MLDPEPDDAVSADVQELVSPSSRTTVLPDLAKAVISDLDIDSFAAVLGNARELKDVAGPGRKLRIGSLYSGSELVFNALKTFLATLLSPAELAELAIEHTMCVEWVHPSQAIKCEGLGL